MAEKSEKDQTEEEATAPAEPVKSDPGPEVIEIRPMAVKAKMRKRHWGVSVSFLLVVILPLLLIGYYMFERATEQYGSVAGFSVRKEEMGGAAEMLGGLSQFMGGGAGGGEADMLYAFIQSQNLVSVVDDNLDLRSHYSEPYERDPIFAFKPDGTVEDLVEYWQRIVKVSFDQTTGLVNLRVVAFSPEMAQEVANEIIAQSQLLVNELNATARSDALRYAEEDLADSLARLKSAREALVRFRTRTQIVDPESDLRSRMGVLASLQQQLAQALIDYDLVSQDTSPSDPRIVQAQRRIDVIRDRIAAERRTFSTEEPDSEVEGYPELLAEYEGLAVEREFAEQGYAAALANLDIARANAARQSRYLATYIRPTLPQKSEYPQRVMILGLAALFLFLSWVITALMFYAFRDRK